MNILITVALAVALLTASVTDIRNQRIYNWLTFPLMFAGVVTHVVFGGLGGLKFAAGGFAVGFVAMIVPYLLDVMGAGDVKLMAGIGAWLGPEATLAAFTITCLAGGVYALVVLAFNPHMFKTVLRNIAYTFLVFIGTRRFNFASADQHQVLPRLCYGVAITVGTVGAMGMYAWQSGSVFLGY